MGSKDANKELNMDKDFAGQAKSGLQFAVKWVAMWAATFASAVFANLFIDIGSFPQAFVASGAFSCAGAALWRGTPTEKGPRSIARKGLGRFLTIAGCVILLPMAPMVVASLFFMDAPSATLLGTLAYDAAMLSVPALLIWIGRRLAPPEELKELDRIIFPPINGNGSPRPPQAP